MANSKCRSDWISSLLTYCLLLMWSSSSSAWHTELVHIWSYFSPHFPTYGLHCCSSLPNSAATCLCLCTCCSLCLDYPSPWSLCKTPILLSKTICISMLLRSLLWDFLPWVNAVYTLCLSPWLHLSAEYSSALRSPKATLRMWGGALIFLVESLNEMVHFRAPNWSHLSSYKPPFQFLLLLNTIFVWVH